MMFMAGAKDLFMIFLGLEVDVNLFLCAGGIEQEKDNLQMKHH